MRAPLLGYRRILPWPSGRKRASARCRFAQITDTHVTDAEERTRTFVEDIQELNAAQPGLTFVVATGDLVNAGSNTNDFAAYVASLTQFRMPIFNLPGNHDAQGSLPHYHHYLGPDYYSFNVGDCHFVLLNCLTFEDQQKAWIEQDLAAAPKKSTPIFALHFLPTPEQVRYMRNWGGWRY